jgi:hypothetical protein
VAVPVATAPAVSPWPGAPVLTVVARPPPVNRS